MLPQDISEKGDLLKKCFAGAAGINATNRVDSNTRFSCFACPTFAGGRSTTLVSYLREKSFAKLHFFWMKLCEKYMHCVELLFVWHKTKKTCRFYYALQKISPARCFSQVFIGLDATLLFSLTWAKARLSQGLGPVKRSSLSVPCHARIYSSPKASNIFCSAQTSRLQDPKSNSKDAPPLTASLWLWLGKH